MAVSLTGKLVITVVVLAIAGGLTTLIVLLVNDEEVEEAPVTTPTTTPVPEYDDSIYHVGVGMADMTGPCVEITFMGYADFGQTGRGIHMRQYSRAFIFIKGDKRVVLVTTDVQAVGVFVRREVVKKLQELYGDVYTLRNVIITGTHTHSTPGGHLVDFLLDVSIRGFSRETFDAYVSGITRSIVRAHENIEPARLFYGVTTVENAQKNRSPNSYEANPPEELLRYTEEFDRQLTQLRVVKYNGDLHGVLNWFAVHPTSMNMTNRLISSDNVGYAAITMEKALNPNSLTGRPEIVTGFFSSNLGDVSPNLQDAVCEGTRDLCDNQDKRCPVGERCYAQGPGKDMFESTKIIGHTIYEAAMEVLNSPAEELTGDIAVVHQFVNMPEQLVPKYDTVTKTFDSDNTVRGCVPAMGLSFGAGTTDGANLLNIPQGSTEDDPFWSTIGGLLTSPTEDDVNCHAPKPILLATGRTNIPVPWHPRIVSATLIMLGGLAVAGVPGEPTTMSGRRIRDVVGSVMEEHNIEPRVVVSGLTNEYIHYIATPEEYLIQRYEAASTIYGPNTLDIFLNKFAEFTAVAIEGGEVPEGPEPENYINNTFSLILPVISDSSGFLQNFGDVIEQPPPQVNRGETVSVKFVGANPRNDLKQESTFVKVERLDLGQWVVVATDADWETKFIWERYSTIMGTSTVTIEWTIPQDAFLSSYRIVYYGASRSLFGNIRQFQKASNVFQVFQ